MNTPAIHPTYFKLTDEERTEMGHRIANGEIEPGEGIDKFALDLESGRKVSGSYSWGSEWAEYIELDISGGQS